jgi:hypothetical protein
VVSWKGSDAIVIWAGGSAEIVETKDQGETYFIKRRINRPRTPLKKDQEWLAAITSKFYTRRVTNRYLCEITYSGNSPRRAGKTRAPGFESCAGAGAFTRLTELGKAAIVRRFLERG